MIKKSKLTPKLFELKIKQINLKFMNSRKKKYQNSVKVKKKIKVNNPLRKMFIV